jgi:hypothetical protein
VLEVEGNAPGQYEYTVEFINAAGSTVSTTHTVSVTK